MGSCFVCVLILLVYYLAYTYIAYWGVCTYIISTWNLNENKKVVIYFVKQLGYSIAHKKI